MDGKTSNIPWMEDEFFGNKSTGIPEIIKESNQIGIVVIFVVSAILSITLLFVIAIFIDCRQEKLTKLERRKPKKILKLKIPRIGRTIREDEATLANKMCENEPTCSNLTV